MVNDKVLKAAAELEDIAVIAKTMCNDLRDGAPNAYARVYWLRKRMSVIVSNLGFGTPTPSVLATIEREYEKQLPISHDRD